MQTSNNATKQHARAITDLAGRKYALRRLEALSLRNRALADQLDAVAEEIAEVERMVGAGRARR